MQEQWEWYLGAVAVMLANWITCAAGQRFRQQNRKYENSVNQNGAVMAMNL